MSSAGGGSAVVGGSGTVTHRRVGRGIGGDRPGRPDGLVGGVAQQGDHRRVADARLAERVGVDHVLVDDVRIHDVGVGCRVGFRRASSSTISPSTISPSLTGAPPRDAKRPIRRPCTSEPKTVSDGSLARRLARSLPANVDGRAIRSPWFAAHPADSNPSSPVTLRSRPPVRRTRSLHEGWRLLLGAEARARLGTAETSVPATVPGAVHVDLLAAGLIPDPLVDRNEDELQWIGRRRVDVRHRPSRARPPPTANRSSSCSPVSTPSPP